MIYRKLSKTASPPVTRHQLLKIAAMGWNRNAECSAENLTSARAG
jgi:hypothetical protein